MVMFGGPIMKIVKVTAVYDGVGFPGYAEVEWEENKVKHSCLCVIPDRIFKIEAGDELAIEPPRGMANTAVMIGFVRAANIMDWA